MSLESFSSTSSTNPVWGIVNKCTNGCKEPILLVNSKYVFGSGWMCQYDVTLKQYIQFGAEEFTVNRYFQRLSNYHFYITREDVDDIRPAIICNLSEKYNLFIINNNLIIKLLHNESRILRDGDYVSVSQMTGGFLLRFSYTHVLPFGLIKCPSIEARYYIGPRIGKGASADVLLMTQLNMPYGRFNQVILKAVHKKLNFNDEKMVAVENERAMREVTAMRNFNCIHVLKLLDYVDTSHHLFLVVPYMEGGSLVQRITRDQDRPFLEEEMARFFFRQLLIGIKYMHSKGWTHRDIKPDNILLSDNGPHPILVIGDLGLSKILDSSVNTFCGTLGYAAPEMLRCDNKTYDNKVDTWSCGIVLYSMLSGNMPFHKNYLHQVREGKEASVMFKHPGFQNVSQSAKMLISSLLQCDAKYRWDAALSLCHKWINNRSTELLLRCSYAERGINFTEDIQEALQNVYVSENSDKAMESLKRMRF